LRIAGRAANRRHVSGVNFGASLRRCDLRLPLTHDHHRVAVRADLNAEHTVMMGGMNGYIRSVNFRFGLAILRNRVVRQALAQLNLNIFLGKSCDVGLRVRSQAESIGKIELQFGA